MNRAPILGQQLAVGHRIAGLELRDRVAGRGVGGGEIDVAGAVESAHPVAILRHIQREGNLVAGREALQVGGAIDRKIHRHLDHVTGNGVVMNGDLLPVRRDAFDHALRGEGV